MPDYDFKCRSCEHIFTKFFSVHEEHRANCVKCLSTHTYRYMGNNNIAVHGFTTYPDPRGLEGELTMAQIKEIEKKEKLVYLGHEDAKKEAAKNKKYIQKKNSENLHKSIDNEIKKICKM